MLLFCAFSIFCMWKLFTKADKPGWACIVPIYNAYTEFDIVYGKGWKFLLLLIPIVNFVFAIKFMFDLAKVYGKGVGFGFGLLFLSPIFLAILALGDAEYEGPLE